MILFVPFPGKANTGQIGMQDGLRKFRMDFNGELRQDSVVESESELIVSRECAK